MYAMLIDTVSKNTDDIESRVTSTHGKFDQKYGQVFWLRIVYFQSSQLVYIDTYCLLSCRLLPPRSKQHQAWRQFDDVIIGATSAPHNGGWSKEVENASIEMSIATLFEVLEILLPRGFPSLSTAFILHGKKWHPFF